MLNSQPEDLQEIGIYKIQEKITQGPGRIVYKAINTQDDSIVTIKQIPLENFQNNTLENIKAKLKLLQNLTHENLVKYIDNIETETHLYIIQEYLPSLNLATTFNEEIVAVFARQILQGLEYLHSHDFLHGEIQAANLLSSDSRKVKLLNYGIMTTLDEIENAKKTVSSLYYLAPEVWKGTGAGRCSDIWSFGCTVIELLTGSLPTNGLNPITFATKIMAGEEEIPLPENISEDCKDFLRKCLTKDETKRAKAKELLDHPWVCNEKVEKEMEKLGIADKKSQINGKED